LAWTLFVLGISLGCGAQELKQVAKFEGNTTLVSATVCQQGRELVGIGKDHKLYLWDVASGKASSIETGGARLYAITCSDDGKHLALATDDGRVLYADVAAHKVVKEFRVGKHFIQAMAFGKGALLAAAGDDGAPQLVNMATGQATVLAKPFGATAALAFSPDGALVASADEDTNVRIYDTAGKLKATVDCGPLEPSNIAFSADGKEVYVSGVEPIVRTIDVASGKVVRRSERLATAALAMMMNAAGDGALLLSMDEYTMAPKSVAIWKAKSNQVRKLAFSPEEFVGGGSGGAGWLLVKQEGHFITLWEITAD